jgi:hypothetical protein
VAATTSALRLSGTLWQGLLSTIAFLALTAIVGAIEMQPLKQLIHNVRARRRARV